MRTVPPPAVGAPSVTARALPGKDAAQLAMHRAGVGAAFGLLVLEFIELAQDIDGNPDVVLREALDAGRVVQEDIRVEDVIFPGGGMPARLRWLFLPGARAGSTSPKRPCCGWMFEVLRDMLVRIELVHGYYCGRK